VAVAASLAWYARSAYFVGVDGDQVAIFRGRPGGFLWFEPTLVDRKELRIDDVVPAKVDELRAGKEAPSKADADRYVNNLRQEAAQLWAATSTTSTTEPPPAPPGATAATPTTTVTTARLAPP
jgi:PPM family protein phosphatase